MVTQLQAGFTQISPLGMIYAGLTGPSDLSAQLRAHLELAHALGPMDVEQLYKSLVLVVYGAVIALSLVFQGAQCPLLFHPSQARRCLPARDSP
ncbi:MAG: hypothetical protein U1E05_14415, partial [Patescibacteria group bacterium]|nr:hypothetical protein [Patescibacteria group bacterium]